MHRRDRRLRPELAGLPVCARQTVPGAIKLTNNETVFGPLPSVRAAIDRATDTVNRYPGSGCVQLKTALARRRTSLRARRRRLRLSQPSASNSFRSPPRLVTSIRLAQL